MPISYCGKAAFLASTSVETAVGGKGSDANETIKVGQRCLQRLHKGGMGL